MAVLLVLGLAGCSSHKTRVKAAEAHWKQMRSTLMMQMAQQQFDAGDLDQAEKTLTEATKIDQRNAEIYTLAGRVAMERGQLERAYHRFKTAIEINPAFASAHYYQGIILQRWARFESAYESYKQAYDSQQDNAAYLLAMSEMLVVMDRSDEAMKILSEKMGYFDMNVGIRLAVGQLYMMHGEHRKAVDSFRQASLIRPEDLQVQEELALALLAAGQSAEAAQRLELLCREHSLSGRADLKRALADSYLAGGRINDAKSVYIQLTRTNPLDVDAWIRIGELSLAQNDLKESLLAANRVQKLAPHRHEGYLLAGIVWSKQGDVTQAVALLDQAAALAPTESIPVILRGITFEQAGQLDAAAQSYAEALRRKPDDARAQQLLAKIATEAEQNVLTGE